VILWTGASASKASFGFNSALTAWRERTFGQLANGSPLEPGKKISAWAQISTILDMRITASRRGILGRIDKRSRKKRTKKKKAASKRRNSPQKGGCRPCFISVTSVG